jgi:hypothetical protein
VEREMKDRNFTDDEVIKALECCNTPGSCWECPYYGINEVEYDDGCVQKLIQDILPFINRKNAEIERLNAVHADMTESLRLVSEANKDMQAEIEKLGRDHYQILPDGRLELIPRTDINAIKAEAIKEFAERLKPKLSYYDEVYVDTLVKEMTEDNNECKNT